LAEHKHGLFARETIGTKEVSNLPFVIIKYGTGEIHLARETGEQAQKLLKVLPYADKIRIEREKSDRNELGEDGEWVISPIMIEVRAYSEEKARDIGKILKGLESPYDHPLPIHFIKLLGFRSRSSGELVF
jgi:hypothetical protein